MPTSYDKIRKAELWKAKFLNTTPIPDSVALSDKLKDYCDENYKLNFEYYNYNQCELKKLQKFKPLIEEFNNITRSNRKTINIRDSINRDDDRYSNLYSGLPLDVDLEEIDYSDTGRIFGFRIGSYMCVVAVLKKHRQ